MNFNLNFFSDAESSSIYHARRILLSVVESEQFKALPDYAKRIVSLENVYIRRYTLANPFSSAIAYTSGNTIYLNQKAFRGPIELAGTIAHEMMHLLGYKHPFFRKSWYQPNGYDRTEPPYFVGDQVVKIAKELKL